MDLSSDPDKKAPILIHIKAFTSAYTLSPIEEPSAKTSFSARMNQGSYFWLHGLTSFNTPELILPFLLVINNCLFILHSYRIFIPQINWTLLNPMLRYF